MSHRAVLDRPASPPTEGLRWVEFDEVRPIVYASTMEMRTAPLRLTGAEARAFADAKGGRIPRAAQPLPVDG